MIEHIEQRKDLWTGEVEILSNEPICDSMRKIAVRAPEFASLVKPGQFLMLRSLDGADPLLGRPFAAYDADPETGRVEAIYAIVGKGTNRLARARVGDKLALWGPLGNGWEVAFRDKSPKRLALVAGGVGLAPFYLLVKELAKIPESERPETTYLFGSRSASRAICLDDFRALGVDARVATEDGSLGTKGFVTDALADLFPAGAEAFDALVLACGPSPMLRAVANFAFERGLECWTSLESPMACGMGMCFSCVVEWKTDDGTWDYKRTCVDGPVFDASRLKWN
ncbi:MAG: dihydroorotate dehydrogenase electron transfer subunit [Thermoguttaceae bacterium]|nr:dihydroorotate dehydrogenase electron transfer subunit [Thermoguttaceae bacterium]